MFQDSFEMLDVFEVKLVIQHDPNTQISFQQHTHILLYLLYPRHNQASLSTTDKIPTAPLRCRFLPRRSIGCYMFNHFTILHLLRACLSNQLPLTNRVALYRHRGGDHREFGSGSGETRRARRLGRSRGEPQLSRARRGRHDGHREWGLSQPGAFSACGSHCPLGSKQGAEHEGKRSFKEPSPLRKCPKKKVGQS